MDVKGLHDFEEKPTVNDTPVLTEGAAEISTLTEKTSLVDADLFLIEDSEASNAKKKVQLVNLGLGGELASVLGRRTTTLAGSASYQDIPLDTTPVENDTDVLEHDNTNTDRLLIKETGLYLVGYYAAIDPTGTPSSLNARVRTNDTTTIVQSQTMFEEDEEITNLHNSFTVELTSGDYITLQIQTAAGDTIQSGVMLWALRARGSQGAQGIAGSGSSITVKDSGTNVANTPHTAINFVGQLAAADGGSGVADISLVFGAEYQSAASEGESSTTSATYQQKLRLTTSSIPAGDYYIGWFFEHAMSGDDKQFGYRLQIDDTTTFSEGILENKGQYADSQWRPKSGFYIATLTAATHTIDLDYLSVAGDTSYIRRARIVVWRVN